jgi:glyoxylase I family protein
MARVNLLTPPNGATYTWLKSREDDREAAMAVNARIQHAAFHTTDLNKARKFYGEILGMKEIVRPMLGSRGVWFSCGAEHELHVTVSSEDGVPKAGRNLNPRKRGLEGRHLAFAVDDLEEIKGRLKANGLPWVGSNDNLPQIFTEDLDGNLVEINSGWMKQQEKY